MGGIGGNLNPRSEQERGRVDKSQEGSLWVGVPQGGRHPSNQNSGEMKKNRGKRDQEKKRKRFWTHESLAEEDEKEVIRRTLLKLGR